MIKKISAVLLAAFLMTGCATFGNREETVALSKGREVPRFFAEGEKSAAFRANAVFRDIQMAGVLMIKQDPANVFHMRIMGPMGTRMLDVEYDSWHDRFTYHYILPDLSSGIIKSRLERIALLLIKGPGEIKKAVTNQKTGITEIRHKFDSGTVAYKYQYDSAYPFASTSGSMTYEYYDYRDYGGTALPYSMTVTDSLAEVVMDVSLISIQK
ncbi:hypothetical protein Dip518_000204 [Parelusimicrobium proximum]|uniref:hypothetical protein n=1 Tax=Parelusimicrobium proximum TaxID=3228953 RepID=UPI003D166EDE